MNPDYKQCKAAIMQLIFEPSMDYGTFNLLKERRNYFKETLIALLRRSLHTMPASEQLSIPVMEGISWGNADEAGKGS